MAPNMDEDDTSMTSEHDDNDEDIDKGEVTVKESGSPCAWEMQCTSAVHQRSRRRSQGSVVSSQGHLRLGIGGPIVD